MEDLKNTQYENEKYNQLYKLNNIKIIHPKSSKDIRCFVTRRQIWAIDQHRVTLNRG